MFWTVYIDTFAACYSARKASPQNVSPSLPTNETRDVISIAPNFRVANQYHNQTLIINHFKTYFLQFQTAWNLNPDAKAPKHAVSKRNDNYDGSDDNNTNAKDNDSDDDRDNDTTRTTNCNNIKDDGITITMIIMMIIIGILVNWTNWNTKHSREWTDFWIKFCECYPFTAMLYDWTYMTQLW